MMDKETEKSPHRLDPMRGRGKELSDMLRAELGVPPDAVSFEIRFAAGEDVTVKCEYFPRAQG